MNNKAYVAETPILNFQSPAIQNLIRARNWQDLSSLDKIGAAYAFVQNEINFGYNRADNIPASKVLEDGYGQCNTKGTLLMALLRGLNIPCRLHGFTIKKSLQRGVVPELIYAIAPDDILHSWVEVQVDDKWINLEGFILDALFLKQIQTKFEGQSSLCAYGVGTDCLENPPVNWRGSDTYIQRTGINNDFGTFDSPDQLYAEHMQAFVGFKNWLYQNFIRHWMNRRVAQIRAGKVPPIPPNKKGA